MVCASNNLRFCADGLRLPHCPADLIQMFRVVLLVALIGGIVVIARPDLLNLTLPTRADLENWIDAAGLLGPVVVVTLMTVAIVASPLPVLSR